MTEWHTSTVLGICNHMRHSKDFSALPILADALQDAGYSDDVVLLQLREGPQDYVTGCKITALLMDEDKAKEAIAFIEKCGKQIGKPTYDYEDDTGEMSFEELMAAAKADIETEEYIHMGTNENYRDIDWDMFWNAYEILTDTRNPKGYSFFSCSC